MLSNLEPEPKEYQWKNQNREQCWFQQQHVQTFSILVGKKIYVPKYSQMVISLPCKVATRVTHLTPPTWAEKPQEQQAQEKNHHAGASHECSYHRPIKGEGVQWQKQHQYITHPGEPPVLGHGQSTLNVAVGDFWKLLSPETEWKTSVSIGENSRPSLSSWNDSSLSSSLNPQMFSYTYSRSTGVCPHTHKKRRKACPYIKETNPIESPMENVANQAHISIFTRTIPVNQK